MDSLEKQLDALWEENRQRRRSKIDEMTGALVKCVRRDVDAMLDKVKVALDNEHPAMEEQIEHLRQMAEELTAAVDVWQQKALSFFDSIKTEQKALGTMVHEVSVNVAARKEELMKLQARRAEEVRSKCIDQFKALEIKM